MNKKLIALAVGSALGLAPIVAPQAKVVVYGHAQVEISKEDTKTAGATTTNATTVRDEARGRIGIKASEKLGNGMTAIAKFEFKLDTADGYADDTNGDSLDRRETIVGLKGNFGTVELGTVKSAYKYSGGVKYDAFTATTLEARGNGGMSTDELGHGAFGHKSFIANSIAYKSPNFNGITGWVTYSPDDGSPADSTGSEGDYSYGVNYQNGPFEVGVAGVKNDDHLGGDATKLYGKYKWGNHTFLGQYESLDDRNTSGGTDDITLWFFGYQLKMGNNVVVFQAGNKEVDAAGTASDSETDYYTVGLIHNLSKKTRLFGGYRTTETDAAGTASDVETEVVSAGLRMIF